MIKIYIKYLKERVTDTVDLLEKLVFIKLLWQCFIVHRWYIR